MENIGQLINMASKYDAPGQATIQQFLEEVTLMTDLEEDTEGTSNVVNLMTIHASKGLEFPIVYIVGVEDNVFPLMRARLEPKELEEERRLMYVAITRTKDILFMTHANSRRQRGQIKYNPPSRFISEIPEHLIKSYNLAQLQNDASDHIEREE